MDEDRIAVLDRARALWGEESQVMLALEEMAELSKELLKNVNRNRDNVREIAAEIADVYVVLEELKRVYAISDGEISELIKEKIDRLDRKLRSLGG
ncbi:MAG: hypothetical protein LBT92_01465 [Rickettsiales bacterium]|jgi:hypothetical protein|nr:hypothetical protein [Rickettsiales bacterium]